MHLSKAVDHTLEQMRLAQTAQPVNEQRTARPDRGLLRDAPSRRIRDLVRFADDELAEVVPRNKSIATGTPASARTHGLDTRTGGRRFTRPLAAERRAVNTKPQRKILSTSITLIAQHTPQIAPEATLEQIAREIVRDGNFHALVVDREARLLIKEPGVTLRTDLETEKFSKMACKISLGLASGRHWLGALRLG
jgi:hypothetical protein